MRPWRVLDRVDTDAGVLDLRQRGDREFLVCIDGRVLMSSFASRSEAFLAKASCELIADRPAPRVLLAGLGVGITLRVALDVLPAKARVEVVELNPEVVRWCRGPLAVACDDALADPRVEVRVGDVVAAIAAAAPGSLDAIVLDLYEGPHEATQGPDDPCWGPSALRRARAALRPGGVLAIWGEHRDDRFERHLRAAGFRFQRHHPGSGGSPHSVWICQLP